MSESTQELERRKRIHEWFKESPDIWKDIVEEFRNSRHNEAIQLKQRTPTSREWSAGYVYAYEEVLDIERYYKKVWTPPTQSHPQK